MFIDRMGVCSIQVIPIGHHPRMVRMVTIIHLSEAPNPWVGPPTPHVPCATCTVLLFAQN